MANLVKNNIALISVSGTSGTTKISVSADPNTGRNPRQAKFVLSGTNVSETASALTVTQEGKDEFISASISAIDSIPSSGATVSITGTSNVAGFAIAYDSNDVCKLGSTVTVGGYDEKNGWATVGDITIGSLSLYDTSIKAWENEEGSTSSYDFNVSLNVSENTSSEPRTIYVYVLKTSGSTPDAIDVTTAFRYTLVQEGTSTEIFIVTPQSVNSVYQGETSIVTVTSTKEWLVTD